MSNSFPSMISNEPPPLEQSDDEDEDSEEFRDFASGLKLDVDPSPMSTPRKDGSVSLPVHNGSITPELGLDSKDSSTSPSPLKTQSKETAKPPEENNIIPASAFTGFTSGGGSIMKTSYIGTLESESESTTTDDAPENKSEGDSIPEPNVPKAEQVTDDSPLALQQVAEDEDSSGDNVEDFKDFESVEPSPVLCEAPKTDHVTLESSNEVGLSAYTEEEQVLQDVTTDSPASLAQENTEVTPPVIENISSEDTTIPEISNDSPSEGEEEPLEGGSACTPEAEQVQVLDQELEKIETGEMSPQMPSDSTNPDPIKEVTPVSVSKGEGFSADFEAFEDEDDDFEDFQVSAPVQDSPISTQKSEESVSQSVDAATEDKDDDDFSNFQANFSTAEPVAPEPNPSNADGFSDDGDDFDDFQAFQTTQSTVTTVSSSSDPNVNTGPSTVPSTGTFTSQRSALLQDKFDVLVKNLFALNANADEPENSAVFIPIDKKLKEESSEDVWNRVEDFEGSQGLVFKWLNSEAHQRLLDSLKIDTSTVVYSGKWGPVQVPRFAASLVDIPLQPQNITTSAGSGTVPDNVRRTSSVETVQDENKAAHPDDAGVMVNGKTPTVNGRILSREAEQIISQLPDLSFMRAKNLVFPNSSASHVVSSDV